MYTSGVTILPVRPICAATGYQPRSHTARLAPGAAHDPSGSLELLALSPARPVRGRRPRPPSRPPGGCPLSLPCAADDARPDRTRVPPCRQRRPIRRSATHQGPADPATAGRCAICGVALMLYRARGASAVGQALRPASSPLAERATQSIATAVPSLREARRQGRALSSFGPMRMIDGSTSWQRAPPPAGRRRPGSPPRIASSTTINRVRPGRHALLRQPLDS